MLSLLPTTLNWLVSYVHFNQQTMMTTESRSRIDALSAALAKMKSTTEEASRCCDQITKRSRQLDSLTSPASDASAMLSQAASNLGATVVLMKDALEKFDTVGDCEPAIERLHRGVAEAEQKNESRKGRNPSAPIATINVSEQDVYAAVDSMEIIRDAFDYFLERKQWRSTPSALGGLERVHKMVRCCLCMCLLNVVSVGLTAVPFVSPGCQFDVLISNKSFDDSGTCCTCQAPCEKGWWRI